MKKIAKFLLLISFSSVAAVHGQTYINGFINANTTWTLAGSPYIVNGNALLSNGYTLTIEPGVVVKFDTSKTLQVDGQLIAIGTSQNKILFTSSKASPAAGDWGEIHFSNISTPAVFDSSGIYLSGSIMKYCDVMYGGGLGYGQINLANSSPYFSRCNLMYSSHAGIYSNGTSYIVDSSMVSNCHEGLVFNLTCSGVIIKNDSIMNNTGGIWITGSSCNNSVVQNNYFFGNDFFSLNFDNMTVNNLTITGNYFINDVSSSSVYGVLHAQGSNMVTSKNYFINDSAANGNAIAWVSGNVSENYFMNNTSDGSILHDDYNVIVECNLFRSNVIRQSGTSIFDGSAGNCIIRDNLFDGNNSSYNVSVTDIHGVTCSSNCVGYFTNNTFKNNSFPLGTCCKFTNYANLTPNMVIDSNNFFNNTANSIVNENLIVQSMKHNNFSNPNSRYELYNNIPYGSPDVYADSNYWGSTNTQHIDSVIYDYFDNGGLSVVYYNPILTSSVIIDTSCIPGILTSIAEINNNNISSKAFPNPFSISTTIQFNRELKNAVLKIFTIYGQKVKEVRSINNNSINVQRENLTYGIYLYIIIEGDKIIANGKFVVN